MVLTQDVVEAAARLNGVVNHTPVMRSSVLDRLVGASLYFKCEHLQKTGAFKFRGASNAVLSHLLLAKVSGGLSAAEDVRGENAVGTVFATHSSGNHGAALACAAAAAGARAIVVMPEGSSEFKRAAVARYGGEVVACGPALADRESKLGEVVAESGATFVHPYDDPRVIAGQGTAALELLGEVPDIEMLVAPVGGGGLLSGTLLASGGLRTVIGAEPAGANDAKRSLAAGQRVTSHHPDTIADGLRTLLGVLYFEIIQASCDDILDVTDAEIRQAQTLLHEVLKQVVEPSAAVTLAVCLRYRQVFRGRTVGLILSGGNVQVQ